jgi:uncharacterized protein
VQIPPDVLEAFCVRSHIRKLSLFGSVLTPQFNDESDVDMLVEFEPGLRMLGMVRVERELSEMKGERSTFARHAI